MKIGVVFTGGTIGSTVDKDEFIATNEALPSLLLTMYREKAGEEHSFITRTPYFILSENLQGNHLELLIKCVSNLLEEEKPDGIIVTHGTDTLQYTAAVLTYVFSDVKIPVMLVSSNYVLNNPLANGFDNFYSAVDFITGGYGTGVFVSYRNEGEPPKIHRGTRLHNPISYSDYVFSIENSTYGYFNTEIENLSTQKSAFVFCDSRMDKMDGDSLHMFEGITKEEIKLACVSDAILQIHPFVGMRYPGISDDVRVILHGSFHSGTIGVTEELCAFAQKAWERQIPFYLVGLSSKIIPYETVKSYEKNHIIPLFDTAYIAQYCKLWLGIGNGFDIRALMEKNYGYDHIR